VIRGDTAGQAGALVKSKGVAMKADSRSLVLAAVVAVTTALLSGGPAAGDDPPPPVVLGPPPLVGDVDVSVWQLGTTNGAGSAGELGGRMTVYLIKRHPKARNVVAVCNIAPNPNRFRVHGTEGNASFKVSYRRHRRNVTSTIIAGSYWTRRLHQNECVRIRMKVVRTAAAHRGDRRRFTVRATPRHKIYGPDWIAVAAHADRAPS
jgi:hypothetical protein